jgi:hypothetical protein
MNNKIKLYLLIFTMLFSVLYFIGYIYLQPIVDGIKNEMLYHLLSLVRLLSLGSAE